MRNNRVRYYAAAVAIALLTTTGAGADPALTPAQAFPKGYMNIRSHQSPCIWNDLDWDRLTSYERKAWLALGWTEGKWDADEGTLTPPVSDSQDWDELTPMEQAAASALGYTQQIWDTFEDKSCPPSRAPQGGDDDE